MGIRLRVEITDDDLVQRDSAAVVEFSDGGAPTKERLRSLVRHAMAALDPYVVGGTEQLCRVLHQGNSDAVDDETLANLENLVSLEDTHSEIQNCEDTMTESEPATARVVKNDGHVG